MKRTAWLIPLSSTLVIACASSPLRPLEPDQRSPSLLHDWIVRTKNALSELLALPEPSSHTRPDLPSLDRNGIKAARTRLNQLDSEAKWLRTEHSLLKQQLDFRYGRLMIRRAQALWGQELTGLLGHLRHPEQLEEVFQRIRA